MPLGVKLLLGLGADVTPGHGRGPRDSSPGPEDTMGCGSKDTAVSSQA